MVINDRLYGKSQITSLVLIELIQSQALQRLKGIGQYGVPDQYYHLKNYSRFEHSVGVMLLLQKLGATETEQIAGLIHDVSHTAFSHVVDWVLNSSTSESYQDEGHETYLIQTDIPEILQRHGYVLEEVCHHQTFSLLDQELPGLCADRIDYALREMSVSVVSRVLPALTVEDHHIVFANQENALLFAENFLSLQANHWGGFEAASRYRLFADALRIALDQKIVSLQDFWQDDAYIVSKILTANDARINTILEALSQKSLAHLPPSHTIVHKKFRFVDPSYQTKTGLKRLTQTHPEFAYRLESARASNQVGVTIPQLPPNPLLG